MTILKPIILRPPPWIPDADATSCMKCTRGFTLMTRRHHCRACGKVFCNACSSKAIFLHRYGMVQKKERVCDDCFEAEIQRINDVERFLDSTSKLLQNGTEVMLHTGQGLPKTRYLKLSPDYQSLLLSELTNLTGQIAVEFSVASLKHVQEGVSRPDSSVSRNSHSTSTVDPGLFFDLSFDGGETLSFEARSQKVVRVWVPALRSLIQTVTFLREERIGWNDITDRLANDRLDEVRFDTSYEADQD